MEDKPPVPACRPAIEIFSYALLVASIVLFAAIRFHLRQVPLERDEGEYAYIGQLMLQGIPPYKLAANMKLPGTYAAYAVMMSVFGQSSAGIHVGMIAVTTLCAFFLFLLGKHLYGPLTGSIAGASYVLLAARPAVLGLCGHATHFVILMALPAILLLLWGVDRKRTGLLFASGLCFGMSFLMKQPGILFAVFAGVYWLYRERKQPWRTLLLRGGAVSIGTAIPYALTCLIMLGYGTFQTFWFWTWSYARAYGSINSVIDGLFFLKIFLPWAIRPIDLWLLVGIGLLSPLWSSFSRRHGGFLAGFFISSCIAVSIGLYFRPHYFILFLPAAALAIGVAVDSLWQDLKRLNLRYVAAVPIIYFLIAYAAAFHGQWKSFYRLNPIPLSRKMYDNSQAFPEDLQVADFIKARSAPQDEIGIIGSEPEICFYAHLRCATSYVYLYPLMEKQKYATQMQADFMQEMEKARPRFLVYVDDEHSFNWMPTLVENRAFLDEAWNFAHRGYRLIDSVTTFDTRKSLEHVQGDHSTIYVFERIEP
jgi:hypothetical protein